MDKSKFTDEVKQKTLDELNSEEETSQENLTRVTSIAQEELKSGKKVNLPDADQLSANAGIEMLRTRKQIVERFKKMSKRGIVRVATALLTLPEEKSPVRFESQEEEEAFHLGQRNISCRFIVMQHHINKERVRIKQEEEKKKQQEEQKTQEEKGEE